MKMNAETLNNDLQKAMREELPDQANLANYIMDTLFISKEATYRRLRGEVPFTFYEVAILSKRLGISIDHLIGMSPTNNLIFELSPQEFYGLKEKKDYIALDAFLDTLEIVKSEPVSEFVVSSNVFPQFLSHIFYSLCKYDSFRWMYQNQSLYTVKPFNEIEFPNYLYNIQRDIIKATMNIKQTCYILDGLLFENMVREMKYFSNVYLINDEDIKTIKKEMHMLLTMMEDMAIKGRFETGNKVDIYISNINSDTAYCYLDTETVHLSMIGSFILNFLFSYDSKSMKKVKDKISSLKRVSTLISGSGEMYRMDFFKNQHKIVETL